MKFKKKPVVIDATQWFKNGDHSEDYSSDQDGFEGGDLRVFTGAERKLKGWEGDIVRYFRRPDVDGETACRHCGVRMHEHGWIDTKEGGFIVCPGDWVITGVQGENYPCKPDIFAVTYEAACLDLQGPGGAEVVHGPHLWTADETGDHCKVCGDGVWGRHRFQGPCEIQPDPQGRTP